MTKLTDEQLDELERTYGPVGQHKCPVCGGALVLDAAMNSLTRYVCGSPAADIRHNPPASEQALNHCIKSEWWDQGRADPRVARLVQEVREARLPVQERMDLLQVDTALSVLLGVLAAVDGIMPPPIGERAFIERYRELVLETIAAKLHEWGWVPEEAADEE